MGNISQSLKLVADLPTPPEELVAGGGLEFLEELALLSLPAAQQPVAAVLQKSLT